MAAVLLLATSTSTCVVARGVLSCRSSSSSSSSSSNASVARRSLLALGGCCLTRAAAAPLLSRAAELVRLEDVESDKLRAAITAAVAGNLAEAERLFTELLDEDQNAASVWSNRGNVRVSLGNYEQALDDYTRAVLLAPKAPVPLLNRAIANEALGRYQDAVSDCQAAIRLDPEEYAAWYNLGNVDVRLKDYSSALSAYTKAAALAPGIAGYRLKQAVVLFQLEKVDDAKRLIQGLVRKYPNYTEAHAALAAILWSQGRRSEAEDELNRATTQDSKFTNMSWVEQSLQWPPAVLEAMGNLLVIKMVQ